MPILSALSTPSSSSRRGNGRDHVEAADPHVVDGTDVARVRQVVRERDEQAWLAVRRQTT